MKDWYDLSRALISPSFAVSSSLRKSLVFWASSLRCTKVSRWWVTRSEAAVSRVEMREPRSTPIESSVLRMGRELGVEQREVRTPP
jgi:hypothetical protein